MELVTEHGHVAVGTRSKEMGNGCKKEVANSRLKDYVT